MLRRQQDPQWRARQQRQSSWHASPGHNTVSRPRIRHHHPRRWHLRNRCADVPGRSSHSVPSPWAEISPDCTKCACSRGHRIRDTPRSARPPAHPPSSPPAAAFPRKLPGLSLSLRQARSFLKKRTKKLLRCGTEIVDGPGPNSQKFFASFFQKRSPSFLPSSARSRRRKTAPSPVSATAAGRRSKRLEHAQASGSARPVPPIRSNCS